MSADDRAGTIVVETRGRLHFGVLDLGGTLGRWFGGIGAAAPGPPLILSACRSSIVEATGEDADRAAEYARRFLAHHRLSGGVRLEIERALPRHVGLGSGTQLGLAVARALAEIYGLKSDPPSLACAVGRGRRSGIGTWTFADGGLVVEGGRRGGQPGIAPLLARIPFPATWQCLVIVPVGENTVSGDAEEQAFAALPPAPGREVERVAHLVLMALLPSLADGDLNGFGSALTEVQAITGNWFASVQGGTFARGVSGELVRRLGEWGARGVGQSSWGPTVYGIVEGEDAAVRAGEMARRFIGDKGTVHVGPFPGHGAVVRKL